MLHDLLRDGVLGPLRTVSFDTVRNGCAASSGDNWRMDPALAGGGILVDHGWHAFYLMLGLADERPLRIRAQLEQRRYTSAAVEDTAHCVIDFPSVTGEIRLTWAAPERRTRWMLQGSDGEVVIDEDRLTLKAASRSHEHRLQSALSDSSHHPDWFGGVVDEFRAALDTPAAPHVNRNEAGWCVYMLQQAYASSRQQARPMEIPAVDAAGVEVAV
jgi:predicted dehydrogenase